MHRILVEFGGFTIYGYGVLLATAYLAGLQFPLMRARTCGRPAQRLMELGIWIIVSALVPLAIVRLFLLGRRLDTRRGATTQRVAA